MAVLVIPTCHGIATFAPHFLSGSFKAASTIAAVLSSAPIEAGHADGSGYLPNGTDCAASGQSCDGGSCVACSPGSAVNKLRLVEMHIGDQDYVVIRNTDSQCSLNLSSVWFEAGSEISTDLRRLQLPNRTLAAGEEVYIAEPSAFQTGDIQVNDNIFWASGAGGRALLCTGNPCSSSNVLDAVTFGTGPGAVLPSGVTFTPAALTSLGTTEQHSDSYLRQGFAGSAPGFLASDWGTGAASRPSTSGDTCPPTNPGDGSACAGVALTCSYGAITCTCNIFFWQCS